MQTNGVHVSLLRLSNPKAFRGVFQTKAFRQVFQTKAFRGVFQTKAFRGVFQTSKNCFQKTFTRKALTKC